MTKRVARAKVDEAKGQGGALTIWSVIAAAFGALLVVSFLAPVDSISVFVGTALPQDLGWLLLAMLTAFASRKGILEIRASRFEILVVGLGLGWLIAITILASSHGNGRAVWNGFWQVISLASCFYIARTLLQCAETRVVILLALMVGSTAMSFVGLEQVLISLPANRAQYAKDPERVLAENGIDAPPGSPRREQFENRLNSPEPFANFALANSLASLLCLGVILSGGAFANLILRETGTQADKSRKWIGLVALTVALLAQAVCLLLTRSRTAYLSILVALGLWRILEWARGKVRLTGRRFRWVGVAVGALVLVGFSWLLTVDRLVWSEALKSLSYRLEYWQATLAMVRDHGWTGVGLGNFQTYYPQYKLEQASEIIADPHNWILDIAATLSVPIAMICIGWIGVALTKGMSECLLDNMTAHPQSDNASQLGRRLSRGIVLGAGVGGGLSAFMLGGAGNLDLPTNVVAWALSACLVWLVWRAGVREISAANLVASVVGLVLCLLSSGSWQASGIAVPLMIVLAIHWQWSAKLQRHTVVRSDAWQWVAPLFALAGFAIFVLQTWRPVMQSWQLVESAASARSTEERLRLFNLAAAADPLDLERAMHKVQLLAVMANEKSDPTAFTVDAARVMSELNRISPPAVVGFLTPKLAGETASQLAANAARRGLPNQDYLQAAGGFYSLAVERYPSSVELLVQHAAACALSEDWSSAEKSVEKAYQISDRTPHLDKKLTAQMIFLPLKPSGFEMQSEYVSAELLADWLRTEIKTKLRK